MVGWLVGWPVKMEIMLNSASVEVEAGAGAGAELGKKKIKTFLVATNIVASRPHERRPTGTPTARANTYLAD